MLLLLLACATPSECPACPPAPPAAQLLEPWEASLLAPYLDDLRQGIRLAGDQGLGVCQGKRQCDTFLGLEPPPLAEGDYLIRAELTVPELGSSWKVRFHIDCTLTAADGRVTEQTHERAYDVRPVSKENSFRLQPLWMIQSPHPGGARACEWSLTPVRADGTDGAPWKGRYSTPAATVPTP